ncbi:MAG: hypothetical protein LBF92_01480 [Synergistaceae bacterium]|jgi:hypothetical protein|nr:hypothetical protein [Synergistaceae bacterium]
MKKTILVLSTVAFLVICGSAAFAATDAGHVPAAVTVKPVETGKVVDIPDDVRADLIEKIMSEFETVVDVTVLSAPDPLIDDGHKEALEDYIEKDLKPEVQDAGGGKVDIIPVLFPPVEGNVNFVDGIGAVAFGVERAHLFDTLSLDEEKKLIEHDLLHHVITTENGLSDEIEEVFVDEDANRAHVYIALVLEKERHLGRSAGRAATEEVAVSFSPVIVHVNRQSSGDGGGGGGCNFGFAGMAAILALVGGTCLSRKARG